MDETELRRRAEREWLAGKDWHEPTATGATAARRDDEANRGSLLTRRRLVSGGVGLGALGLLGGALVRSQDQGQLSVPGLGGGEPQASCVDASALTPSARLGRAQLVYDPTGKVESMRFDAGFLRQLQRWKADFDATSRHGGANQVWSFGAHVVKDECRSWHANGRAFDISRLKLGNRTLVSARFDLWSTLPEPQQVAWRRGYWALAASLHLHFAYVLTHHFDELHHNHLHVDNGISGSQLSSFGRDSRVQNQAVQAICAQLWGRPGEVTGQWSDTRGQVGPVLDELGVSDLRKQATWQAFLRASVRRG